MTLKESLRNKAIELGFDLFGVARAAPATTADFFAGWLDAGYQGEMGYLSRRAKERGDPRRILAGARSVICVGTNYYSREPDEPRGPLSGRVARYAWGEDYHRVMGKKLRHLADYLERQTEGTARCYVDTGPVLEREYASLAGLGWFGKNTMMIREGLGSWILLGEILTDLDLDPDDPVANRCGTCTRCIDACPTGAILEPYLLDSNACISYLTIEYRGVIPEAMRGPVGDYVFGCDICQDVCPWNHKIPETGEEAFRPREGIVRPDLVSLLEMTEEEWRTLTSRSAIRRTGWRGMRRNAAVALGNSRAAGAVPALRKAMKDPDPLLRAHVAWALGRLDDAGAKTALRDALPREDDPLVRREIDAALGRNVSDRVPRGQATGVASGGAR